jgi:hypothetical protein
MKKEAEKVSRQTSTDRKRAHAKYEGEGTVGNYQCTWKFITTISK